MEEDESLAMALAAAEAKEPPPPHVPSYGAVARRWGHPGVGGGGAASRPPSRNRTTQRRDSNANRRPTFIGKRVSDGEVSWGGVERLAYRYIGNVRPDVQQKEIEDDLRKRGVNFISLESNVNTHGRFKSFKLTVNRGDLEVIDQPNFWPCGISYRPFRLQRSKPTSGGNAPASDIVSATISS